MLPVKLVTFDVTGTLLFFRTPILEKYLETGLKFGIEADRNVLKQNFKDSWITLNKEYPNFGYRTSINWLKWWERFVEGTFKGYIDPEEKEKVAAITEDLIAYHSTKEAFIKRPGTDDLLEYLRTKSLKLGIISNYDPRLFQILDVMELKHYFDFILVSYDVGYSKPDARIFEEALRLGHCASGDEAMHVGDDAELDYLGAKAAGLRAALMSTDEKDLNHTRIKKDEVFQYFYKLKTFFKDMFSNNENL